MEPLSEADKELMKLMLIEMALEVKEQKRKDGCE